MVVTILVLIMVGISGAYISVSMWNQKRTGQDEAATQALFIAESGAAAFIANLNATNTQPAPQPMKSLAGGYYWVPPENVVNFADKTVVGTTNADPDYWAFQVAGKYNGITRRLDVLVTHKAGGVFWNAVFAGNMSNGVSDPKYVLSFDGNPNDTTRQDSVRGSIYTAGGFQATNNAVIKDANGAGAGSVTFGGTNSSSLTGPVYTKGTEPDLSIPRTNSYTDANGVTHKGVTQAEYMAATMNGGRDANGIAWVNVAGQLGDSSIASYGKGPDGTSAYQIQDHANPAHIFRKDPTSQSGASNRTAHYEQTVDTTKVTNANTAKLNPNTTAVSRADYYLEDPAAQTSTRTAPVMAPMKETSMTNIPVNGDTWVGMINIAPSGNNAVYFVDGNLRVSSEPLKSYQLRPDSNVGDLKMTIVVKGNVSLTDNILYPKWESTTDALAIIALKDEVNYPNADASMVKNLQSSSAPLTPNGVPVADFIKAYNDRAATARSNNLNMPNLTLSSDQEIARVTQEYNKVYGSGNVYFGDPGSGTVEHFESYLYAENNFYATNLDSTQSSGGTKMMEIYGNMTAGNQVSIDRSNQKFGYVPLKVVFDPLIMNGGKPPPGLPATPGQAGVDWHIASWKQSAMTAEADASAEK